MSKFVYLLWICLAALTISSVNAQQNAVVQFSGIITAVGTDIEVPYVSIRNTSYKSSHEYMSNFEGYFSFVARKGDVIEFSSIGYKTLTVTVPDVEGDRYTLPIEMESMVEELPVVTVGPPLPWASVEEFTADFLGMISTDESLMAKRNLSPEALASLAMILPRSAEEIQGFSNRMQHVQMSNRNMHQNALTPFTNPFAWAQLINQIKKGNFSRQKLKY